MYHLPQPPHLHHNFHNEYQPYSVFNHEKSYGPIPIRQNQTVNVSGVQHIVPQELQPHNQQKEVAPETRDKKKVKKVLSENVKKVPVDTSSFTIEERLVAAVWMHERKRTKSSISQIKQDFFQRFGRQPPAKNTLLVWERKLFSTGSVHDAPRPGRPIKRGGGAEAVAASLARAPGLSVRARARALRLPRSSLRTILLRDLGHAPTHRTTATGKQRKRAAGKKPTLQNLPCEARPADQHFIQGYT